MTAATQAKSRGAFFWGPTALAAAAGLFALGLVTGVLPSERWDPFLRPTTWGFLGRGLLWTLFIASISLVASLAISLPLALARAGLRGPGQWLVSTWIEGIRATPVLVILVVVFFGLQRLDVDFDLRQWYAVIGLTVYTSAVLAEIVRAGIVSIPRGEVEAARSLGLPWWPTMRHVVLPQAYARMTPALVSQLITLNKDTTLVSIIAIQEVISRGSSLTAFGFFGGVEAPVLQVFILIGLMFIAVNLALSRLSRRLEVRERQRTGTTLRRPTGLEDQVAAEADVEAAPPR